MDAMTRAICGHFGPGFDSFGVYQGSDKKLLAEIRKAEKAAHAYFDKHGIAGEGTNRQQQRLANLRRAAEHRGLAY